MQGRPSHFVRVYRCSGNPHVTVVVHAFDPNNQLALIGSVELVGPGKIKASSAEAYVMAYGWGKGSDGQFGTGTERVNHRVPIAIKNPQV
jgi:hypothetical protein